MKTPQSRGAEEGINRTVNTIYFTPNDPISKLLPRLDKVRQQGDGWIACCPAHDDKNPSLSVADTGDRILIKCWAGCSFEAIASALGMQPHEFFIDGKAPTPAIKNTKITRRQFLDALDLELRIAFIANRDRLTGRKISTEDLAREKLAKQRIVKAWRAISEH